MTQLQQAKFETRWFCETCMETTIHKRVFINLKHKTYECQQCGEQFTHTYEEPKWRTNKRKYRYRYAMRCTHCGHTWNTKALKQPKMCPKCKTAHIVMEGLTREWRRKQP